MKRILLCDDEARIRDIVKDFLVNEGYIVIEAKDGEEALSIFNNKEIDLAILDIMMPKIDGWDVCKEIRRISKKTPIIMLTAKGEEVDELYGFEIGADEYIVKPFRPSILVARVNALLRRISRGSISLDKDLVINDDFHEVRLNRELIDLSPKEYELLLFLYENKGKVFNRQQLLDKLWGFDSFVTDRTVDTHINRLRIKLEDKRNYIKTIRGFGYKFEVD
ncbi:transcriptional regulatory protein SsrA [Gottschalkia acidurici 9a]|uniref:Transcriptional regulatory protein SsrA n=1 Tax=Gottschalkia acidurici (strain ATCC 7906 / DSM 604 / BCRC 14475 / CIP 104303 / KCTC 5404 / NCIMB 10678 / 9a) TaxID=1128398 RepID=K0B3P6_GOTA9|nr:response regulator transcription factor [Gottschalkia acidurici]AFS79495.1 transcriptional regulatory protein SsrA [Gottschalkia acidurici 9a]